MVILFLEWNSYGNEDLFTILKKMGHTVIRMPFERYKENGYIGFEEAMDEIINLNPIHFVFSFNYYPQVSVYCQKKNHKYVSWVYDSPFVNVYSYTLINPCNYVFLFDKAFYLEFKNRGIDTVYYLPMAANVDRLDEMIPAESTKQILDTDIAFVGSLYTEEKHNLYKNFENISPFAKGYLDGLIQAQLKVYGYNFIQEVLPKGIIEEMKQVYSLYSSNTGTESDEYVYGEYVLSRQVTAIERREILEMLSQKYSVQLHTNDENVVIGNVQNMGLVDYYEGMPYVFKCARINLNISLRSIKSGIPLRAMDIMGCGGFLLTNYQEEFLDYFVPDEDFVYYTDYEDLMDKVEYYLLHEEERKRIAKNGHDKVKKYHTYEQRLREMISIITSDSTDMHLPEGNNLNSDIINEVYRETAKSDQEEKVTVIIPTYNREKTILRSIQSVLDQTYSNLEVLVIDDGSTDKTADLVNGIMDARVKFVQLETNGGVSNARNLGVELAMTEWVAFQDSDDCWHKDKLEKQMRYAGIHPEYSMIYCMYKSIHEDGTEYMGPLPYLEVMEGHMLKELFVRNVIGAPMMLVKKSAFKEAGGFDVSYNALEDWDFVLRFAKQYQIGFIPEMLIDVYTLDGGISSDVVNYYEARCRMLGAYKNEMIQEGALEAVIENILTKAKNRGILDIVEKMMTLYLSM